MKLEPEKNRIVSTFNVKVKKVHGFRNQVAPILKELHNLNTEHTVLPHQCLSLTQWIMNQGVKVSEVLESLVSLWNSSYLMCTDLFYTFLPYFTLINVIDKKYIIPLSSSVEMKLIEAGALRLFKDIQVVKCCKCLSPHPPWNEAQLLHMGALNKQTTNRLCACVSLSVPVCDCFSVNLLRW